MDFMKETDGFIAPIRVIGLSFDELQERVETVSDPEKFIQQFKRLEKDFHTLMHEQGELAESKIDDRARERAHLAAWGWGGCNAVARCTANGDTMTAVVWACRIGWCIAKLEDLGYENAAQGWEKSIKGSAKGAQRRRKDKKFALAKMCMVRRFMANPNAKLCEVRRAVSVAIGINEDSLRNRKEFRRSILVAEAQLLLENS